MTEIAPLPDAIVFDVDGVLVETEGSYIEAVVQTVGWLAGEVGLDHPAVDRATVHEWKRTGPWNDDWDLSYEMYRRLMEKSGLPATRTWEEVRGVFEEIYNGTAVAVQRYGTVPRLHQEHGLAETERILLDKALLQDLVGLGIERIGVVTGRSLADWSAVAKRMPLPHHVAVATMEDGRKPDAAPLRKVLRTLRPRAFVSVGDTRADLELVQRWNASEEGVAVPGTPVMLCPAEDESAYRQLGATLFIRSLWELPALLRGASSPRAKP